MKFRKILAKSLALVALTCILNIGILAQAELIGSPEIFTENNSQKNLEKLLKTIFIPTFNNTSNKILTLLSEKNDKGESFFMYLLDLATSPDSPLDSKEYAKGQIFSLFESKHISLDQISQLFNETVTINSIPFKAYYYISDANFLDCIIKRGVSLDRECDVYNLMFEDYCAYKEENRLSFPYSLSYVLSDDYSKMINGLCFKYPLNDVSNKKIIHNMSIIANGIGYPAKNMISFMKIVSDELHQIIEIINDFFVEIHEKKSV